ncbi:MAG: hypothetical protein QF561_01495 [Phycisphaerales bacterium]|jgi:hypothetical protein|nr:hypothetical protein [Phycisphaerales bacterium]
MITSANVFCVAACCVVLPSVAMASSPSMEDVAPPETVAVLDIQNVDRIFGRLEESGLLEGDDAQDLNDGIRDLIGRFPDSVSEVWLDVFESHEPTDVLGALSASIALWVDRTAGERGELVLAGWVDLGDNADAVSEAWDDGWRTIRGRADAVTESLSGRDVDVIDGRLGEGPERPIKEMLWHVREDSLILLSNTQSGLQRMLDVLDGDEVGESLADVEAWESATAMLEGPDDVRLVLLVEGAFAAAQVVDQMGMAAMAKASFDATIGPVRAAAVSAGVGSQDDLFTAFGALWMPDGPGGLLRLLAIDSPRDTLPGWIGPDVVSLSRFNVDFKRIPDWLRSVVASNPMLMGLGQLLDQFEPSIRAILGPLDHKAMMVGTLQRPLSMDSLNEVTSIACTDPSGLKDALAAISPKGGFEPRDFQGHQIWTVDASAMAMMPIPIPGDARMSLAVAGHSLFIGSDAGVESALRSLSARSATSPPWLTRAIGRMPSEPMACWSTWDVGEHLTAVAEVQRLQLRSWEDELMAEDPELWEEIKGELTDEEGTARRERLARIASRLGPAAWWAQSGDDGFRIGGVLLTAEDDEGE